MRLRFHFEERIMGSFDLVFVEFLDCEGIAHDL
jgi:hypothetical protein